MAEQNKDKGKAVLAGVGLLIIAAAAWTVWHFYRQERDTRDAARTTAEQATQLVRQVAALEEALTDLNRKMDTLETQAAAGNVREASLILALISLREDAGTGRPFRDNLTLLKTLLPKSDIIASLEPYADKGVPSMASLQSRFARLSHRLDGEARLSEAKLATGKIRAMLRSLVVIRKVDGTAVGNTLVSRAERALVAGDLKGAVAELSTLEGRPAETIAPWLHDARERMAVDYALSDLMLIAAAAVRSK